jgi:Lon-like ATP-dependent protease
VGGVEEKLQAAKEAGVTCVFLPKENWKENFDEGEMQVIPVEKVQEILERVFLPESLAEGMELLKEKGIS